MTQQLRIAAQAPDSGALEPFGAPSRRSGMARVGEIEVTAAVELGRAELQLRELACLGPGAIVRVDRMTGEAVDLVVNGRTFARGEIVIVDDHLGLRVTELVPEPA